MPNDQYGCLLSTQNSNAIESVNKFSSDFLAFNPNVENIGQSADHYPQELILQIYAALFYLSEQKINTFQKASEYLDKASYLLEQANDREKSLYSFAWHWLNQLLTEALKIIERHCFKWPKDLTAIKLAEILFYWKGQKYEAKRFLRLTTHCYYEHQQQASFLAIHAFALELNTKYEESLQVAKRSLLLNEYQIEAYHTLAHLYLNKGWIDEGIQLLIDHSVLWSLTTPTTHSHYFWHLTLFHLENLDFEKIREIYQMAKWENSLQSIYQGIDAISLLWRLDLEKQQTSDDWIKLTQTLMPFIYFIHTPFVSAHICYALKKGNKEKLLQDILQHTEKFAYEQIKEERFVWKEVGLPLIYGCIAFADHQYVEVLAYFEPIISQIDCVGGNDIQTDLFHQMYLKSLMGAQQYDKAEALFHKLTQGKDLTKLKHKWLTECQVFSQATIRSHSTTLKKI